MLTGLDVDVHSPHHYFISHQILHRRKPSGEAVDKVAALLVQVKLATAVHFFR